MGKGTRIISNDSEIKYLTENICIPSYSANSANESKENLVCNRKCFGFRAKFFFSIAQHGVQSLL